MNRKISSVLRVIMAIGLCVLGRWLCVTMGIPLMGNQIAVVAAAYYMGPVYGVIVAILSGLICMSFDSYSLFYILPIAAMAIICGQMAKHELFLKNLYHTVSIICFYGLVEAVLLTIPQRLLLKDHTVMEYSDIVLSYCTAGGINREVSFFISSLSVVFIDISLCLLAEWALRYLRNPMRKKWERRKYLRRNMASMLVLIISVSAIGLMWPAKAQAATEDISFIQRIYSSADGLAGGTVNDIAQTEDGTMWVATYEGLYRFNGEKFEIITDIPNVRSVMCLLVDSNNNMWIGNNGTGIAVTGSNRGVVMADTSTGLPSDTIREIAQIDDSHFAIATAQGLAMVSYDGESIKVDDVLCEGQYIKGVSIDSNSTICAYNNYGQIIIIRDNEEAWTIEPEDVDTSCAIFGPDGRLYVGTSANSIYVYEPDRAVYTKVDTVDMGELNDVSDLYFDDSGYIYIAASNGICYMDDRHEIKEIYTDDFDSSIVHVMKDYQGNMWFTSTRCGLLSLVKSGFSDIFDSYNIPDNVVNTVTKWNDMLYVGTDAGLYILNIYTNSSLHNSLTERFDEAHRIRCMFVDSRNSLWICDYTDGAFEITDQGDIYQYNSDMPGYEIGNKVRMATELHDGSVLISGNSGMAIIKDHKITDSYICNQELGGAYVMTICELQDGTLLAGSDGDGIEVIQNGAVVKTLNRADGLSCGIILRIVKDPFGEGEFVLTGSGMCYINADYTVHEIENFPYFNNVDMKITETGTVVVLSTAGVFVLDYDSLDSDDVNATLLDVTEGLPGPITSNAWNYLEEDGTFYMCGGTGVYSMNIYDYGIPVDSYKPIVSAVTMDGTITPTTNVGEIEIPSGVEKIDFTVEINNFTTTDPYVRYYLTGIDDNKNVCKASELGQISYDGITHGTYKFVIEVLADNEETVLAKNVYTVVKDMESYEMFGFKFYLFFTLAWMVVTFIVMVTNIASYEASKRNKSEYEHSLNKLEREKAQALETALHHEEAANKSKSDFLASMSHEIRTPINAIIGMDTMILRETNQDAVRKYASDVKSASETLLSLINDILDFSKIESGKMEIIPGEYEVSGLLADLVNMIKPKANGKDLALNVQVSPEIPAVLYGDDVRIRQIILNILNNAVKYTESGHIDLIVESKSADATTVALTVKVADTGIGIKQEDIKKLFSPYERIEEGRNKKIEGTGLGMSITKNLLQMMNSQLVVDSVYGEGSTFSFTILQQIRSEEQIGDFNQYLAKGNAEIEDIESYHAPDAHILVVDDVDMNLIVVQSLLKRIKIQITTARSGKEAIELTRNNRYDIIFLDSMMPELSGEDTLKIIRDECRLADGTPIVALTANAIKGAREEYLSIGFDNYLSKPIEGSKLEAMIHSYLPEDKIVPYNGEEEGSDDGTSATEGTEASDELLTAIGAIPGIELAKGIETAGGEDIYKVVCRNFYDTATDRIAMIEQNYADQDIKNYTIQVHALKSSARLIGAFGLSEKAFQMEQAGREENIDLIREKTGAVIDEYKGLLAALDQVYGSGEGSDAEGQDTREPISAKKLKRNLRDMSELIEAFDMASAKELFKSLDEYAMPDDFKESQKGMRGAFAEVDRDRLLNIINDYLA